MTPIPTDRPLTAGDVPLRGPGHCDDDKAWAEFVRQYSGKPRSRPDMTDFALANAVFMADRNDLDLIVYQTAAKERIRWLSIELAKALSRPAATRPAEDDAGVGEAEDRPAIRTQHPRRDAGSNGQAARVLASTERPE